MSLITKLFFEKKRPKAACFVGAVLILLASGYSFFQQAISLDKLLSIEFGGCLGLALVAGLLGPGSLCLGERDVDLGFTWTSPIGLICLLAGVFVHPFAIVPVTMLTVLILKKRHWSTPYSWSTGPAAITVPYVIVTMFIHAFAPPETAGFFTWLAVLTAAVLFAEVLNWMVLFPLGGMVHGRISKPSAIFTSIKADAILAAVTIFVVTACYAYGMFVALVALGLVAWIAHASERAIHNHENFLGMRSLSWGVTTTALNFMSKLDDRTYRHSLNTARYTRDALQRWGFPKAVQDLGYMAGLLHQAGLAGVAKRLRIAEEEFTRDDIPPIPLEGEKTFNWNDLRTTDPDDEMQAIIEEAKRAAGEENPEELTDTIDDSSSVEPAWWRPQEGKCFLSAQDIMTLDLYPTQTALLLEGASLYGGLPDILAQYKNHHGEQTYLHQNPQIACAIANILKIAVTYETLTAVDGSFIQKPAEEALTILHERAEEFDADALNIFTTMMNEQSPNYRNGTDLAYEHPQEELMKLFAHDTPGPLSRKGWKHHGNILQKHPDHEKEFAIQFANDYLSHTTRNNKQKNN